jgi:hypothetical protein
MAGCAFLLRLPGRELTQDGTGRLHEAGQAGAGTGTGPHGTALAEAMP